MDTDRFDHLTRAIGRTLTRRRLTGLISAAVRPAALAAPTVALVAPAPASSGVSTARFARKVKQQACKRPKKQCGKQCVSVKTSTKHCGGCNQKCARGGKCKNGTCTYRPGTFLFKWGEEGTDPGQLDDPTGITVATGEVFVTDPDTHRVLVFNRTGKHKVDIGMPVGVSEVNRVAVKGDMLYITDPTANRVLMYLRNGTYQGEWSGPLVTGSWIPTDIAVAGNHVYVASRKSNEIQVFDLAGNLEYQWGATGTGDGKFQIPTGLAIANNRIYVADRNNFRIQVFDLEGQFLREWGGQSPDLELHDGLFQDIQGIAVADNRVYVVDSTEHRVQVFTLEGDFVRTWGSFGTGNGELYSPLSIAVAGNQVYVVDDVSPRVQVFAAG